MSKPGETAGQGPYEQLEEHDHLNPSVTKAVHQEPGHQQIIEERARPAQTSFKREWTGLLAIVLVALGNQWQRFILAYVNGVGAKKQDPKTEIAWEYQEYWSDYYGILSGLAFTFTFAVFGIFGGVTADNVDRKAIIVVCSICWSLCTLLSGIVKSFWVFFFMRVLLGFFQAFMNPAAYSMIADYFPPDMRTRASSVFNLAIYLGGAMASLSQVIIVNSGWRFAYSLIAFIGLGSSVLGVFLIYNPPRGRWEVKKEAIPQAIQASQERVRMTTLQLFVSALVEIFLNPTCRWVAIGGFFRFFGGFSIGFFMPKYFIGIWGKDYTTAYAVCNATVVSIFGLSSSLIGGYVGDILETKGILMTKAYICVFSAIFGSVFFSLCTLIQIKSTGGFAFSISMLALEYLCAENWIAPAITMLMNTISAENKGFGVSAYLFFCTLGGTVATGIAQPIFNAFDVSDHPERSGYILCVLVLISYLGSIPFFLLAGHTYTAYKLKEKAEKEQQENSGF